MIIEKCEEVMILKILMRKPLYEMANLSTEDSKLYYNIWIDYKYHTQPPCALGE